MTASDELISEKTKGTSKERSSRGVQVEGPSGKGIRETRGYRAHTSQHHTKPFPAPDRIVRDAKANADSHPVCLPSFPPFPPPPLPT